MSWNGLSHYLFFLVANVTFIADQVGHLHLTRYVNKILLFSIMRIQEDIIISVSERHDNFRANVLIHDNIYM